MKPIHVVITGAGRGIGLAVVRSFLEDYNHIRVFAISRNTEILDQLVPAFSSRLVVKKTDLAAGLEKGFSLSEEVQSAMGQIHILVNNAGQLLNKQIDQSHPDEVRKIMDINLLVPGFLSSHLLPIFDSSVRGHIINIGSMGGFQGSSKFSGLAYYSASKGALAILSECMASEWKDRNIAVNCLALGSVNTEMLQQAFPGYSAQVSPEAMGRYIAHFALTGAEFMNGKILPLALTTP